MKLLALDFGEKRIGIAVGNSKIGVAAARNFLENNSEVFGDLVELVKQDNVEKILVGLPRGLRGETEQTKSTREFAAELETKTSVVVVELVDERFTSQIAESNLHEAGENARKQKKLVDSEAARIILQEYLDNNF